MKSPRSIQLSPETLKLLALRLEPKVYRHNTVLFYAGQVPLVGHVLLSGEIRLIERKRRYDLVPGCLLGLHEMLDHRPLPFSASISAHSQVYVLDKSLVQELILPDPQWRQLLHA